MNIAIYGRGFGNSFNGMIIQLFEEFKIRNVKVFLNKSFHEFITKKVLYFPEVEGLFENELPGDIKIDFFISIGGDGSFLESASIVKDSGIPIVGINTGRLGILAYVNATNLLKSINQIIEGDYILDKRMLLEIYSENRFYGNLNFCLNDFTIQKYSKLNMIKTKVCADDNYINTYWSDGLIFATPTGSTAYSMSCGGPIVVPGSNVITITPIANHNLTVRPLVLSADTELKVSVDSSEAKILVSLDHRAYVVKNNVEFFIKKAKFNINFVNLLKNNYFSTLRNKLMWGIDARG
ncbi:MAG: NAD kinase [Bacteroidales bacterium]|jgi:NAD+ kinase|nr:NAD kinase [Bacteroidales bacterium]HOL98877.1 NAD kinase [Bacteroidales bacterium]HPD24718.1 NAD kinase [Bacteroidales bacterium]HRT00463.1 NAD kinase [Bacteroidales bacterium]HRT80937.1 NAD kinase [Bacteroidales bacterium]